MGLIVTVPLSSPAKSVDKPLQVWQYLTKLKRYVTFIQRDMSQQPPSCKIDELISACQKGQVEVLPKARRSAEYFGFRSRDPKKIIEFIAAGMLENHQFINETPLRSGAEKPPPLVYAYSFRTGGKMGYLAFYYQPKDGKWKIKSLKPHEQSNNPLAEQLAKFLN